MSTYCDSISNSSCHICACPAQSFSGRVCIATTHGKHNVVDASSSVVETFKVEENFVDAVMTPSSISTSLEPPSANVGISSSTIGISSSTNDDNDSNGGSGIISDTICEAPTINIREMATTTMDVGSTTRITAASTTVCISSVSNMDKNVEGIPCTQEDSHADEVLDSLAADSDSQDAIIADGNYLCCI